MFFLLAPPSISWKSERLDFSFHCFRALFLLPKGIYLVLPRLYVFSFPFLHICHVDAFLFASDFPVMTSPVPLWVRMFSFVLCVLRSHMFPRPLRPLQRVLGNLRLCFARAFLCANVFSPNSTSPNVLIILRCSLFH